MPQKLPDFSEERKLWQKGFKFVGGVDEVGRGAWAGPIVAAAVVFPAHGSRHPSDILKAGINDSKQVRPRKRERLAAFIRENALAWGIGEVSAAEINRVGLARASRQVFRRAVAAANEKLKMKKAKLNFLLIDAFYIPFVRGLRRKHQRAIIDGDQKSVSIAAASILAKVYRDKLMKSLSRKSKYKIYGWGRSKGYGTKKHQNAIKRYGLSRLHRKNFVTV